jgi:ubiquinone/menaquinone biosynthesis C-methylase UbiE
MDLRNLQKNWNAWGKLDPLWAILSFPGKEGSRWNLEDFFKTGQAEINQVLVEAQSFGLTIGRGTALDFGCGVGRLTQALCQHFDRVYGVDIASSMIRQANRYNRYGDRCVYVLNLRDNLSDLPDQQFDFIYSCRVLQHMEPRYCMAYVGEFIRLLAPDGVLVFQQPAAKHDTPEQAVVMPQASAFKTQIKLLIPEFLLAAYWKVKLSYLRWQAALRPQMEMYCIAKDEMISYLAGLNARLVDVREDDAAPGFLSLRYFVVKN